MAPQWYRRLADVPGVPYQSNTAVKRSRLAGHSVTPTMSIYEYDGKRRESLIWPAPNGGSGSWAPTRAWNAEAQPQETPARTELRQLHERLELPGTLDDYEWVISVSINALWEHRQVEPWVVREVEHLCWLNIAIIEADPSVVAHERSDGTFDYYGGTGFHRLIALFENNGYLHEALELAERGTRLKLQMPKREQLRERLAVLEHEDAG